MTLSKTLLAAAAVALLAGVPAQAGQRGAAPIADPVGVRAAQARAAVERFAGPVRAGAPPTFQGGAQRAGVIDVASARPAVVVANRAYAYSGSRAYRGGSRGAVVVGGVVPGRVIVAPRVVGVAPVRFYRPYYSFRPHVSLGFGLWAGFPVAYAYGYYNPFFAPYGYPYPPYGYRYPVAAYPPYPYPPAPLPPPGYPASYPAPAYPMARSVGVRAPAQTNTGGMSFEITPGSAQLFIDGEYVGTVGQFTPTSQPLGLTPGRHRVEIRAEGYRTMDFDVEIAAGQVIPYQGALER